MCAHAIAHSQRTDDVTILGVVLLVLGLVFDVAILVYVGAVLAIVGAVLFLLGMAGRSFGGRRHYF